MLYDAFEDHSILDVKELDDYLSDLGFMIVPIEDPTNLFGEDDG